MAQSATAITVTSTQLEKPYVRADESCKYVCNVCHSVHSLPNTTARTSTYVPRG